MIDTALISKEVVSQSGFYDTRGQHRQVIHSRVCTDEEHTQTQQRIAEELFRIFMRKRS